MRALVLTDFHRLDLVETARPEPGPGEVLLRLCATGICGSDFHGFTVVDFKSGKETKRIELPSIPVAERVPEGTYNRAPSHGIGVAPGGLTLWACSRLNGRVYAYSLPDLKLIGEVKVGDHPDWITFSPDGKFAYAANGGSNNVSVIDVAAIKEVTRIAVGKAPKRNITATLP